MNGKEARKVLAERIKSDRIRKYGTVEKARQEAEVSRGSWDAAEAGKPVKEFTLNRIEKALGWEIGDAAAVLVGGQPSSHLEEVEASSLSEATKRHIRELEAEVQRLREAQ